MALKKDVVLVIGSSGCLGQFIVKLLQERDDNVAEIRLFDNRQYKNTLGHPEVKRMTEYIYDIREPHRLQEAMEGVDCVIHCAAIIDLRLNPDIKRMETINIDGTAGVINACLENNVSRLIFASSTDMVCGSEHIFYGTESTTPIPTTFMIGKYGETKCKAEKLVLGASGRLCADGRTALRTVSLRPTPFFGENDKHFFIQFFKTARLTSGCYQKVRSLDERLQISYVGNVAWAFVKAKERLAIDETLSGEAFFITDDMPIIDIHEHVADYLRARGLKISDCILPYWLAWIFIFIASMFIKFINIFYTWEVPAVPTTDVLNYMCSTFFYNRSKATLRLNYQPIYTPEEAKERSLPYYRDVRLY